MIIFFFKQKTAYELRISDWSQTCALPIYSGVAVALEARYGSFIPANTKAFAFQPFVFFDAAWVWNKDAAFDGLDPQKLFSAGGGVRVAYGDLGRLDVTLAVPATRGGFLLEKPDPRLPVSLPTHFDRKSDVEGKV